MCCRRCRRLFFFAPGRPFCRGCSGNSAKGASFQWSVLQRALLGWKVTEASYDQEVQGRICFVDPVRARYPEVALSALCGVREWQNFMGVTTSRDVSAQLAFYLQKSAAMKALGAAIVTGEGGGNVVR